ncbi:MAG: acyltransferase [Polyangiaceae bacterium]
MAHVERDAQYDAANFVRISDDVRLGVGVRISSFVNAYGCSIGDGSQVGSFVEIQRGASIGNRCKISSHTFICEGVTIEDECFVGHGVIFINDRHPAAVNPDGALKGPDDWTCESTIVRRRANIGSGAVILCGVEIGEGAMVGAGAVVTSNVAAGVTVVGAPARLFHRA